MFNEPFSLYRRSGFQRNKSFYLTIHIRAASPSNHEVFVQTIMLLSFA